MLRCDFAALVSRVVMIGVFLSTVQAAGYW